MPPRVFISYSHRNQFFAERLKIDIERAGIDAFLDRHGIAYGAEFEAKLAREIAERTHLVLLLSPEACRSPWVKFEVAEAQKQKKEIVPLWLAGGQETMPPDWTKWHMLKYLPGDYWEMVRRLVRSLAPPGVELPSPKDLLESGRGTVADAETELRGAEPFNPVNGRKFVQLPVAPSAYGMTWLIAPREAPFRLPDSLGLFFNFTSSYPGKRHEEALGHWMGQVEEPWLLMIGGPIDDDGNYRLSAERPHEWNDSIKAGVAVIEQFTKGRRQVGYYLNAMVPLAFEIGLRSTMLLDRRRVYHYNTRGTGVSPYEVAFDGWADGAGKSSSPGSNSGA